MPVMTNILYSIKVCMETLRLDREDKHTLLLLTGFLTNLEKCFYGPKDVL